MKRCPTCLRAYADDTLSFCLQDGTTLLHESDAAPASLDANASLRATPSHRSHASTEVLDERTAPTEEMPPTVATVSPSPHSTTRDLYGTAAPPPKTQNTALVVGLTVIATLILIALGGVGVWLYTKDNGRSGTTSQKPNQNDPANKGTENLNGNVKPKASVAPSASPTPAQVNSAAVREQVTATLNGWTSASRERNLDKHMSFYADTLDTYYSASNVSASRVRSDRERAYTLYDTLDVDLSDIKITPDPTGESATATFDKTWTFEGEAKYSSGSVHQKVWLKQSGGRWRITGEKDLQVYYVNTER